MRDLTLELRKIRLDLIDKMEPYGIRAKDLYRFDDELRAIADLPSYEREKQLNELRDRIRSAKKKQN